MPHALAHRLALLCGLLLPGCAFVHAATQDAVTFAGGAVGGVFGPVGGGIGAVVGRHGGVIAAEAVSGQEVVLQDAPTPAIDASAITSQVLTQGAKQSMNIDPLLLVVILAVGGWLAWKGIDKRLDKIEDDLKGKADKP